MARRTYLPTLVLLARAVLLFVTKYRVRIVDNLPEGGDALLDALLVAIQALLDIINLEEGD